MNRKVLNSFELGLSTSWVVIASAMYGATYEGWKGTLVLGNYQLEKLARAAASLQLSHQPQDTVF